MFSSSKGISPDFTYRRISHPWNGSHWDLLRRTAPSLLFPNTEISCGTFSNTEISILVLTNMEILILVISNMEISILVISNMEISILGLETLYLGKDSILLFFYHGILNQDFRYNSRVKCPPHSSLNSIEMQNDESCCFVIHGYLKNLWLSPHILSRTIIDSEQSP